MNPEERQKILDRAAARRAQNSQPAAAAPTPEAPQAPPKPFIRATGGVEIRIVDADNPPTEVQPRARRQGIVQRQAGPAHQGPRTLGARVVNPGDLEPGPRMRATPGHGSYGATVVPSAQAPGAPGGVAQALRTPLAPGQAAPPQAPPAAAPGSADLNAQIAAMGAGAGAAPGAVTVATVPGSLGDVTVIMTQHVRPETLEQQYRALRAAGVSDANMRCWVNPAGVRLNDGLLGRIPHVRASADMGPWMRWTLISQVPTKYVLVIDDDCTPGPDWLRLAVARLERAESDGDTLVVAAAGLLLDADQFDKVIPVGPESLQRAEIDVDLGRGAWLMPTDLGRAIANFPQVGSPLATSIHVAAAAQHAGASTVVLPYPHNERGVWGMLEGAKQPSMSSRFDRDAKETRGPDSTAMRRADYDVYRHIGWEPIVVIKAQAEAESPPEPSSDAAETEASP